jgi:hypothetical protein
MKNSEEAIEKLLAGLRDAEAPAGMEQRILSGLEARALRRAEAGGRWFAPSRRGALVCYTACGVLSAGVLIVALAVPAIRRIGHRSEAAKVDVVPAKASFGSGSDVASRQRGTASQVANTGSTKMTHIAGAGLMGAAESGVDPDAEESLAMSEMRAASFPAPPMPLTEEERLLLRMVHRTDPVELAMLDPKLEAIRDAEEKAEFQRFFARPAMKPGAGEESGDQPSGEPPAPGQASAEASTPQSSTAAPVVAEPVTPEPVAGEPAAIEPDATEPSVPEQKPLEQKPEVRPRTERANE